MFLNINIGVKYTVITTFNQSGLDTYGQRMIDTFEQYWPADVNLLVCTENCQPRTTKPNVKIIDLLGNSPSLRDFVQRHENNDLAHGRAGPPDVFNLKKQFRWNAVRFSYKVFSVALCAGMVPQGWMIWLDADSHSHSPVTADWLSKVCPQEAMMSYLGRGEKYHSECGWVAYNLDHAATRSFIQDFVGMYENDTIFKEREWHDSYIWDVIRKQYQIDPKNQFHNLNPSVDDKGLAGHPFINSELGRCMDHVKGKRKYQGHSKAKEIVLHHDIPYWQKVLGR
jgi:hypothetical protein